MQPSVLTAEAPSRDPREFNATIAHLQPAPPRAAHLKFIRRLAAMVSLMVVVDHSIVPPPGGVHAPSEIDHVLHVVTPFLQLINMPVFFFMAGLLFAHSHGVTSLAPSVDLIQAKARRLVVPYWAISSLAFPVKCLLSRYALRPVTWSWQSYFVTLVYPWANTIVFYWFLLTLFLMFFVAPGLQWLSRRAPPAAKWAMTLVLVALFVNFDPGSHEYVSLLNWTGVLHYVLLFWFGIVLYPYVVGVSESNQSRRALLRGFALLGSSLILYQVLPVNSLWGLLVLNSLGIATMTNFAIGTQAKANRLLDLVGRNTYQIFLFSWFFHHAVILLSKRLTRLPIGLLELSSLCLGVLGPIGIAYIVRKIPQPRIQMLAGM